MEPEDMDSRTSLAGVKRSFNATSYRDVTGIQSESEDESLDRLKPSQKRQKMGTNDTRSSDQKENTLPWLWPSLAAKNLVKFGETSYPHTNQKPKVISWNQGTSNTGLRTSFGSNPKNETYGAPVLDTPPPPKVEEPPSTIKLPTPPCLPAISKEIVSNKDKEAGKPKISSAGGGLSSVSANTRKFADVNGKRLEFPPILKKKNASLKAFRDISFRDEFVPCFIACNKDSIQFISSKDMIDAFNTYAKLYFKKGAANNANFGPKPSKFCKKIIDQARKEALNLSKKGMKSKTPTENAGRKQATYSDVNVLTSQEATTTRVLRSASLQTTDKAIQTKESAKMQLLSQIVLPEMPLGVDVAILVEEEFYKSWFVPELLICNKGILSSMKKRSSCVRDAYKKFVNPKLSKMASDAAERVRKMTRNNHFIGQVFLDVNSGKISQGILLGTKSASSGKETAVAAPVSSKSKANAKKLPSRVMKLKEHLKQLRIEIPGPFDKPRDEVCSARFLETTYLPTFWKSNAKSLKEHGGRNLTYLAWQSYRRLLELDFNMKKKDLGDKRALFPFATHRSICWSFMEAASGTAQGKHSSVDLLVNESSSDSELSVRVVQDSDYETSSSDGMIKSRVETRQQRNPHEESFHTARTASQIQDTIIGGCRLFLNNLPWSASDEDVTKLFTGYTILEVNIPQNQHPSNMGGSTATMDQCLRHAFVDLMSSDEAKRAVSELNGKSMNGMQVIVELCHLNAQGLITNTMSKRSEHHSKSVSDITAGRFTRSRVSATSGAASSFSDNDVHVTNIAFKGAGAELYKIFRGFLIVSFKLLKQHDGSPTGHALVRLSSPNEARKAVERLHGQKMIGRQVGVYFPNSPDIPSYEHTQDLKKRKPSVIPTNTRIIKAATELQNHGLSAESAFSLAWERTSPNANEIQDPTSSRSNHENANMNVDTIIEPTNDAVIRKEPMFEIVEIDTRMSNVEVEQVASIPRDLAGQSFFDLYYPGMSGDVCMVCMRAGHQVGECNTLTCRICKQYRVHFTQACPENQRCVKCLAIGHLEVNCPEKLKAPRDEHEPCSRCDLRGHDESTCDLMWRSYTIGQSVSKVRSIPVSCYNCGSGHFGAECGLRPNTEPLTGGKTWTRANLNKYLDFESKEIPVNERETDITSGPSRKVKDLPTKGKVREQPIELDDSDDDYEPFLGPKVQTSRKNQQTKSTQFQPPLPPGPPPPQADTGLYNNPKYAIKPFEVPAKIRDGRSRQSPSVPNSESHFPRHPLPAKPAVAQSAAASSTYLYGPSYSPHPTIAVQAGLYSARDSTNSGYHQGVEHYHGEGNAVRYQQTNGYNQNALSGPMSTSNSLPSYHEGRFTTAMVYGPPPQSGYHEGVEYFHGSGGQSMTAQAPGIGARASGSAHREVRGGQKHRKPDST